MSVPMRRPVEPSLLATAINSPHRRSRPAAALRTPQTTVLGAGHGGLAMAGYLAAQGVSVQLWNRSPAPVHAVAMQGFIRLSMPGQQPPAVPTLGKSVDAAIIARIKGATCCMETALSGAQLVLVVLPSTAHRAVARLAAPYLRDGQTVLLMPGRTGGALEFLQVLRAQGCTAQVAVAEAQTFPFASRTTGPAAAAIHGVKCRVEVAACPADRTAETVALCRRLLPMLQPARSVLQTSLENMGAMLHPVVTLLNAGRIEGPEHFLFYVDGVTPGVATALARADAERLAVARAYGVEARSLAEWMADAYGENAGAATAATPQPDPTDDPGGPATAATLRHLITTNPAYQAILAPTGLDHRYVWEDVPTGLVPLAELGRAAGVPCPTLDALIATANAVHGTDYRASGRNLSQLGLSGLTPQEVRWMAETGEAPMVADRPHATALPDLPHWPIRPEQPGHVELPEFLDLPWEQAPPDAWQRSDAEVLSEIAASDEMTEWSHTRRLSAVSGEAGDEFLGEVS